ncbi:MAG TPA: CRTAC1 family protein [Bacteroidales bacterium]|nr:CRTAC1 family protein [Bacteroidales bacterium]
MKGLSGKITGSLPLCSLCNRNFVSSVVNGILVIVLLVPSVSSAQRKGITFKEISKQAGINFKYTIGDFSYVNILESSGSGITVFDYNNDNLMDIFMMNGTWIEGISDDEGKVFKYTPDALYRNNGDGTFTDIAVKAGVDDRHWTMAASAVDYDNDGDQDLYLLNYGPNVFYRNNGDGTFTDITSVLGLQGPDKLNGFVKWSIGASFWDYNLDGRLDVMVGNFLAFDPAYVSTAGPGIMPHPSEYKGQASMLYEQMADGTFKDVSARNNLYYPDSKCMGLTIYDYDNDGDMDIFQANDHHFNFLFRNDNGSFKEVAVSSGVAANTKGVGTGSMHGSLADVDGDGLIDILVTDLAYGALYRNLGNGLFEDIIEKSGIAGHMAGKGSWGGMFFDYDNDGDPDIIAANGTAEELILQYPLLLENDGKGNFRNVGQNKGKYFREKRSGRGLALCDYDNDGDMDIIISHVDKKATAAVLRNEGGNSNHWLGLILKGKKGPAAAISARVTIRAGEMRQVLINQWATGYLSANDQRLHIGLGKNNKIDSLEIRWSDGTVDVYNNILSDRYITIIQGKGIE